MRELHVTGLDDDGQHVLLTDTQSGDRYRVALDDRLRTAARGDVSGFDQAEVQATSNLSPRQIQTRIRAGATIAQIAEEAGVPASRVERFAHPVLLERSNIADLARRSGATIDGSGPEPLTFGEQVAAALAARGIDPEAAQWDAWRVEGEPWVITVHWQAGRSADSAHWTFHRQAGAGRVVPRDEPADALLDPDRSRPLRTVAPVTSIAPGVSPVDAVLVTATAEPIDLHAPAPVDEPVASDHGRAERPDTTPVAEHAERSESDQDRPDDRRDEDRDDDGQDALIPHPDPAAAREDSPPARRNRPTMPSWEDVLLGVRSHNEP